MNVRRLLRILLFGLLALGLAGSGTIIHDGSRVAAANGPRYSLQPYTANPPPPDYFTISAQSGQVLQESVVVTNVGDTAGMLHLFPVDSTTGQNSGVVYRTETDPRSDVGTWIAIDSATFMLNAGESRTIPFTITVPASPRSGQHVGGLVAQGTQTSGSGQVTIQDQEIIAVLMDLPAPFTYSMAIPSIAPTGTQASPQLLLGLSNDGTMLVTPSGTITIKDAQGHTALQLPLTLDTFVPQTQIAYPLSLQAGALALGDYTATIVLNYGSNQMTTQTLPLAYYFGPTLTRTGPSSGVTTGGGTVTLTGFAFGTAANTQVLVNGTALPAASIRSVAARSITFTAPAHAAGNVTITVSVGGTVAAGSVTYLYGYNYPLAPPHTAGTTKGPVFPVPVGTHPTVSPTGPTLPQPGRH